jgi:hypothetical protein
VPAENAPAVLWQLLLLLLLLHDIGHLAGHMITQRCS